MKCPKCKSNKTVIRTVGCRSTNKFSFFSQVEYDIWRCLNCGNLWETKVDIG